MSKEKDNSQEKEKVVLTEWQKRNLEFLKKKKEKEAEKEELEEKRRQERKETLQKEEKPSEESEKADSEDDDDRPDKKDGKSKDKSKEDKEKTKAKGKEKSKKKKEPKAKKKLTPAQKAQRKALPIFLVAGIIILFSLFLLTPFSKQKTVTVEGATNTTSDEVLAASGISASDYFFSLIFKHYSYEAAVVANDSWVKSAKLSYHFFNNFTLTIEEYKVVGYTQVTGGYEPILENGRHESVISEAELPDTYLTINLDDEEMIQTLVKAFAKLDESLVSQIQSVSLANSASTADLLTLAMTDGNTVRVPLSEIITKLPYYDKIKGNLTEASIVDMEVGIYTTTETIESEAANSSETTEETSTEEEAATEEDATTAEEESSPENTAETAETEETITTDE